MDMIAYLLSKNRSQQAQLFLVVVLATLATLVPIHLLQIIIDSAIPSRNYNFLLLLGGVIAISLVIKIWLEYIKAVLARRIQEFFISDLRLTLMTHIMDLPSEYFSANPIGKIVSRVMHDVARFGMGIEFLLVNPVIAVVTICIYGVYLFTINPTLTLATIIPLPIVILASAKISKKLSHHRRTVMNSISNYTASINEIILATTEIQSNGTYQREQKRLSTEHRELSDAGIFEASLLARIASVSSSYREFIPVIIYCYGGWLVMAEDLSIGHVVAFSSAFAGVYFSIDTLVNYIPIYQNVRDRFAELEKILAVPRIGPASKPQFDSIFQNSPATSAVDIHNLTFTHPSGARIINNVTLTFNPGEHIALVGRSGGGKSTLLNLIAGRLQPSSGTILYGKTNHENLESAYRVGIISYVQQSPFIFSGMLRDNLLYGVSDQADFSHQYSEYDLLTICSKTGLDTDLLNFGLESLISRSEADDFIAHKSRIANDLNIVPNSIQSDPIWNEAISIRDNLMPHGCDIDDFNVRRSVNARILAVLVEANLAERLRSYGLDFNVGERGSRLSGGQKQKVSIARALIRKRPILLLDEITASLDEASTMTILKLLETDLRNVTVIAITHELDTITSFDRVIGLNEGEIHADMSAKSILADRAMISSLFDREPLKVL